ncbi:hypothetical protein [Lysinibacillus agricola]|uniref:hypothetical protein n=1 Tax=Lysinibacillus agricola TaxID=2590012 RepID=UPI003C2A22DD
MFKKDLEKLTSKQKALAILKLWEEGLKIKNEVNEDKVNLKKVLTPNVNTRQIKK